MDILLLLKYVFWLFLFKTIAVLILSTYHKYKKPKTYEHFYPGITIIVPAFNEEVGIEKTLKSIIYNKYKNYADIEIIVVDDGSSDLTPDIVREYQERFSFVKLISKKNGGKATALNRGIAEAKHYILVTIDADTILGDNALFEIVKPFFDAKVGAVAGKVLVGNNTNAITLYQDFEYTVGQELEKRAQAAINSITVIPGAIGAFRKLALQQVVGYSHDTLAEDMDVTIAIASNGWKVIYVPSATSITEPPNNLKDLISQKTRWMVGGIQVLWKYRNLFKKMSTAYPLFLFGLPYTFLFGIVGALIAPAILVLSFLGLVVNLNQISIIQIMLIVILTILTDASIQAYAHKNIKLIYMFSTFQKTTQYFFNCFILIKSINRLLTKELSWNKLDRKGLK